MKINNLLMNSNMLDKISADILKIDKNKNDLFYNRFQEEVNLDSIKNFNEIKSWEPIYELFDNYGYAIEVVFLLTNNSQYGIFHNYNAGGSALDYSKALIANNKDELKEIFSKMFAANGLNPLTDERTSPRFNFAEFVDSLPELTQIRKLKI